MRAAPPRRAACECIAREERGEGGAREERPGCKAVARAERDKAQAHPGA